MDGVKIKTYLAPPLDEQEALRYALCGVDTDDKVKGSLRACIYESEGQFSYRVCYVVMDREKLLAEFPKNEQERLLSRVLGAEKVVVFCATVGLGIDRLVNGYSRIDTEKALLFQALGTERVESLCDVFCEDMQAEHAPLFVGGRFSPGYGNLPLQMQQTVFALLNCQKHIGVTLGDGLLMTPTKSVTAFLPLYTTAHKSTAGCVACNKQDCVARKENT